VLVKPLTQHVEARASARRASEDHEFDLAGAAHGAQLLRVAGATNLISIQFQLVGESKVHVLVAVEKQHNRVIIRRGASVPGMERIRRRDAVIGGHLASFRRTEESRQQANDHTVGSYGGPWDRR